ncbi:MAG: hypothetical protein JWN13_2402 [Betaproteobacteria bacterium]|jgi:hypothetical protein|nr:hypothetical protein [Betaproteobacteria bacterium]
MTMKLLAALVYAMTLTACADMATKASGPSFPQTPPMAPGQNM